jgi:hypothetical protein
MRAFILHDGEDDAKTDELQEFLKPLKDADGDWEGDNSGITVWMPPVAVGDAMLFGGDGGFRVLKKGEPVRITKHAFRHVYDAMLLVEHDNGAHHANRIHPGMVDLDTFLMPFDYGIDRLLNADAALGWLADEDGVLYEDLIIGEQGDQLAVVKKHRDEQPGLVTAHELINDWFNAWTRPYAWEK